jgi:hypothetical protein
VGYIPTILEKFWFAENDKFILDIKVAFDPLKALKPD